MAIDESNIKGLLSKWGLSSKPCHSCNSSSALLFCRPHSAFLCLSCDSSLHSSSSSSSPPHPRVWICEVCEQSPASVTCKADAAALCQSCDRDIHSANPLSRRHPRLPVVPFFHTPQLTPPDDDSWLIPNLQANSLSGADFVYSSSSSDLDSSFLDSGSLEFDVKKQVEDYSHLSFADSVVPNQTSIVSLLNGFDIDFAPSKLDSTFNFSNQCISQTISSSDVGIVPDGINSFASDVLSKGGSNFDGGSMPMALSKSDREARVMRYREKRKNRKFEKTIRYASRKAYAEARPRIKGRFAKRTNSTADAELDRMYTSTINGGFLVDDELYGVVPSF